MLYDLLYLLKEIGLSVRRFTGAGTAAATPACLFPEQTAQWQVEELAV